MAATSYAGDHAGRQGTVLHSPCPSLWRTGEDDQKPEVGRARKPASHSTNGQLQAQ
jgi:hypothetical protein